MAYDFSRRGLLVAGGTLAIAAAAPLARLVGCLGTVTGDGPFPQPAGYIEGAGQPGLFPPSLYEAQFLDRLRGGL
ncbi:hypothetical protein [Nonomuraea sp. NEAU-A123]|uniref:hypothetical protein n=1 Tax=Nonomuraea sp. NEAU-A123 TaxID=2839649 RepID=UPI001BE4B8D9|nr:hypothetical protein [Nonomuraea sp. NEAU-A123]MBT2228825.1 hypothetical protein [Nonomuraea sp. NEAU-A123]